MARRTVAIVQARMGSTRLPGKAMLPLGGVPIIELVLTRVAPAEAVDEVVLATTYRESDDLLATEAERLEIPVVRGPEMDVLHRFSRAAERHDADTIVRVCADNPLISPRELDRIISHHHETKPGLSTNGQPFRGNGYPDGLGASVFNTDLLAEIDTGTNDPSHREHVTKYVWDHEESFEIETVEAPADIRGPEIELDVDTVADYRTLQTLFEGAPTDPRAWTAPEIVTAYRSRIQ